MRRKQDLFAYLDELAAVLVREHGYSERKARGVAETFGTERRIDAHVDDRRRKFDDLAIETVEKALRRVNGKAGG